MKTVMIVPTFWGRDSQTGWQMGDEIYDHPTPLDQKGTLGRLIDSLEILNNKNFELVILLVVTSPELRDKALKKVKEILQEHKAPVKTYLVSDRELEEIKSFHCKNNKPSPRLLSLKGYSNVRNICLYSAYLLEAEVLILIDDDEIFEDPQFIDKTHEFIGGRFYGQTVDGVAGYYLNKNNEYYDDVEIEPWMTFWNRFGSKKKAFDKIIGKSPRLKKTPFAFGGLMVIHRNLFRIVPFDPELTRGEDIDYLINARMFGFNFFLDNQLNIKHLSPGKKHSIWQHFRQDIYRFFYERAKIKSQYEKPNMILVKAEDFNPYPGEFLKDDLEDKVFKTNTILALDYLSNRQINNYQASIKNIYLAEYEAIPPKNVFEEYLKVQDEWYKTLKFARKNIYELKKIISNTVINRTINIEYKQNKDAFLDKVYKNTLNMPFFQSIKEEEKEELIKIFKFKDYKASEIIAEKGRDDNSVYIVIEGEIKIVDQNTLKQEEIKFIKLKKGDLFGLTSLISSKSTQYLADVISVEPSLIASIKREELLSFLSEHHKSGVKLTLYLMKELNDQLENLIDLYTSIESKSSDISDRF